MLTLILPLSKIDSCDILSCDFRNISWLCEAVTQSEEVRLKFILSRLKNLTGCGKDLFASSLGSHVP